MPAQVGVIYAKAEVDITDALRRLDTLEGRVRQLEGRRITISTESAVRGLQNLSKVAGTAWDAYNKFTSGIQRAGDSLVHFGQVMATWSYRMMLATAPISALGVASLQMAAELEQAMAMVATQLDLRGNELDEFTDSATRNFVELSTEIPIAAKDMADALYYLVSSMTIEPEIAEQFIEPIAKAAVAGKTSARDVAESVTPVLNVYKELGRTVEDVRYVLDVYFETVRRGRGEFADIAVQVGDFIQFAKQAGATFEEAMAVFAMATRVTTPAQAATWVANLYRSLTQPAALEALHEIGVTTSEIVEGTGKWAMATRELTEDETERLAYLQDRIPDIQERIKEAILDLNIQIDKSKSTWDDYTGSIIVSLETGQLIEGVSKTGINAFQRLQKAQADLAEAQTEAGNIAAKTGRTYQYWTGEKVLRPSIDIIKEIAEYIGGLRSEEEKLLALQPIFPRIRAMQGATIFIENLAEIIEWEEEFRESSGLTEEAFSIMVDTLRAKADILKNTILTLGFDFLESQMDRLKGALDAMKMMLDAVRDLPPDTQGKMAAIAALLVAAGPLALGGSVVVMGIGALINLFGALISLPSLATITAVSILFGDKLTIFLQALSAYGGGVEGFATAIADLAVHFGILDETDAIGILEKLGITVSEFDDEKIDSLAQGIEDIVDTIQRGIDDVVEWKNAFGLFLEDVQNREGYVGTLVGHLERLYDIVSELAGMAAPKLGLPTIPYEEWTEEEKAGLIDKSLGFLIGSKLASFIFSGMAQTLSTLVTAGALLKIFGIVGTGASAAVGTGVMGTVGSAIGIVLAGSIALGLNMALRDWAVERFPEQETYIRAFWQGLFPPLTMLEIAKESLDKIRTELGEWWYEDVFGEPRGEIIGRLLRGMWDAGIEWFRVNPPEMDLPGLWGWWIEGRDPWREIEPETPEMPEKYQLKFDMLGKSDGLYTPISDTFVSLEQWLAEIVDADYEPEIHFKGKFDGELTTLKHAFDTMQGRMDKLTRDETKIITLLYKHEKEAPPGYGVGAKHLGGYPSPTIANLLPSEFVLSPYTTHLMESYLGKLNQPKVQGLVTHAPIELHAHFYKGSIRSREDGEVIADAMWDRIADRARGKAYAES